MFTSLPTCTDRRWRRNLPLLLTGALALALNASAVRAQAPAADAPATAPATTATPATPSVNNDDRDIMQDLAHAHHAELESARLALEKSKSERVRQFAQQM
ncbi:MAG: hypothetical protein RL075_949, partial [Pseudomonadota bacterium]